jgi:hypothetical protein
MIELDVTIDPRDLRRIDLLDRQAPFAIARALTRTAQEAQGRVREELPERFTIRSRWVPGGIRYRPATKAGLVAQVGSVTPFMEQQEVGGEREGNGAVPIGARRKITDKTGPSRWPKALLAKKAHFLAPIESGSSEFVIWRRYGRKRIVTRGAYAGIKRQPLELMYRFDDDIEIQPRLGLLKTTELVVRERFVPNFEWAYERAIATAR